MNAEHYPSGREGHLLVLGGQLVCVVCTKQCSDLPTRAFTPKRRVIMTTYGNASASTSGLEELDRACSLPINLFILGLAIAMLVVALWILIYYCVTLHILRPTSYRTIQINQWTRPIPRSAIYEREMFRLQGLPTTHGLAGVPRDQPERRFSSIN